MIEQKPKIDESVFVAPGATVIGDVHIGEDSSVWYGAVARGDSNTMRIGKRTNIQDLCVLHANEQNPLSIGDDVTVGHRALLHGCTIKDRVLVGMGAIVMNGACVGEDSIVGAGALVTEGTVVPPRSLILGIPAKVKRELSASEVEGNLKSSAHYVEFAKMHKGKN